MEQYDEIKHALLAKDNYLILTHHRPDGDTVGSAAALQGLLKKAGKTAYVADSGELTRRYLDLIGDGLAPADFVPEAVIAVDIADEALLPKLLSKYAGKIDISIDHHPSNKNFAPVSFVDPKAAAAGEIIYSLFAAFGITPDLADYSAMYVAVLTDTGCFRFSNTTPLTHEVAAKCIAAGIDFHKYNQMFIILKSPARFEIEKSVYASAVFTAGGAIAGACISQELIKSVGATEDDMDNLASMLMCLEQVKSAVFITETADGKSKASVRCQKPLNASEICGRFGGGGHVSAAGCTLETDIFTARDTLMAAAAEELNV